MKTQIYLQNSSIWQLSSVIVANAGECVLVDPAYFPRELEALTTLASQLGKPKSVVFTHGHWDHIVGWASFPTAQVFGSRSLAEATEKMTTEAVENLRLANEFDSKWYIERPTPLAWPKVQPLTNGQILTVGECKIHVLEVPGHSSDGLALLLEDEGILIAGDYLSPCEIPFIDNLSEYQNTLRRFLDLFPNLNEIIPGHGPRLTSQQALEIAQADLKYLITLGNYSELKATSQAESMQLPRAANVVGMHEAHLENCRKLGI